MIIVLEVIVLLVALSAVLALFLRVRCPPEHALVLTNRSADESLRSGPPAFQVLPDRGTFRLPSAGAVDLLDLSPLRFDAFVPVAESDGTHVGELHAIAQVRVSRRAPYLRRAAVRVLGMPRRDLDAVGEGTLAIAVRDAIGGLSADRIESGREAVEADVRAELGGLLDELGMEIVDLQLRLKKRDG